MKQLNSTNNDNGEAGDDDGARTKLFEEDEECLGQNKDVQRTIMKMKMRDGDKKKKKKTQTVCKFTSKCKFLFSDLQRKFREKK